MTRTTLLRPAAALGLLPILASPAIGQETRFQALADLPFVENRPTPETAPRSRTRLPFQRATQTYLWALPLINTLGMKVGSEKAFGAGYNVLPIWKKRLDAKTLVTTPNSDVIYAMSYIDLGKDGPMVMEAPPDLQGILLDFWQRPIPVDWRQDSSVTSVCPDRTAARAASSCSCRPATRERCPKAISSTVQGPTTSSSSCAGSIRTRTN